MATTYTQSPIIKRQYLDNSGNPLASGKLYTLEAGGSWPADAVTTYQTSTGTAHTNPIILDSAGRIPGSSEIFLTPGQTYKFICATSATDYTTPLWTQDGIGAVPGSAAALDFTVTLGSDVDAGDLLYLSDGTAITAGTWGLADSDTTYSSTLPELAFAVTAGTTGNTIQVRQGGLIDLSGLTPGSKYYVSATAGEVTATAPINARYVGQAISTTQLVISGDIADSATDSVVIDPKIKTLCEGRLSLTTGVPVTVSDVTAAGTLYWVPYQGNNVGLYSGSRWVLFNQAQLSIAVPAVANQVYDVFIDYNSGTPALSLTAWTNDTTRATALTTQDGIYVLTGATNKRYVGSVRTVTASQLNDSVLLRHVWNYYHRLPRLLRVLEATNTWTYDTATWRQANNSTANQVDVVVGVQESLAHLQVIGAAASNASSGTPGVAIDMDAATAPETGSITPLVSGTTVASAYFSTLDIYPAVGRHYFAWIEMGSGSGGTTWYGDNGATNMQTGITGWIDG